MSQRWEKTTLALDKEVNIRIGPHQEDSHLIRAPEEGRYETTTIKSGVTFVSVIPISGPGTYVHSKRVEGNRELVAASVNRWSTLNEFLKFWDAIHEQTSGFVPVVFVYDSKEQSCRSLKKLSGTIDDVRGHFFLDYRMKLNGDAWSIHPSVVEFNPGRVSQLFCAFKPADVKPVSIDLAFVFRDIAPQAAHWGRGSSKEEFSELIEASRI